jgi:outer membrane protein assembly factor BamE (lipoprotein component of BamABCDE complex)
MSLTRLRTAVVAVVLLSACAAGVNFIKPPDDKLVLGSTTKEQIIAMMGKPNTSGQKTSNGESLDVIGYVYAKAGAEAAFEGVTPARYVGFTFRKDVLVGKESTSSFKADSTYFDTEKAKSIKMGMTYAQVVALLGMPGGEYRYPAAASRDGKALVYTFAQTKGSKWQRSVLVVDLDEKGIVQKANFDQAGQL